MYIDIGGCANKTM